MYNDLSSYLDMERALRRGRWALLDLERELEGVRALLRLTGERERLRESRPPTPRWGSTCCCGAAANEGVEHLRIYSNEVVCEDGGISAKRVQGEKSERAAVVTRWWRTTPTCSSS